MKSFFKNVLSTVVGMVLSVVIVVILFVTIISISIASLNSNEKITIKPNTILKIDLSKKVVERTSPNPLDYLSIQNLEMDIPLELQVILENIEKAATDTNIKAIYINTAFVNAGLSQTEEIRNKLVEFKKSGKQIIAYSEFYTQSAYYLASVADKIYLNPEGIVELKGLSAGIMFYKGLLEKLDIDIQIIRHGKFKSAIEPFVLDKMSNENRKQIQLLLNSFADNIMDSIANQRGISLADVQKHANNLSLENAESCLQLNYVDALLYQDQIEDSLLAISNSKKLNFISLSKYSNVKLRKQKISRNKIAIIYATGSINPGKGYEFTIGSETTAKAIKTAREDKNIKAIVLRVNSPGGSALASDVIWRETVLAKAKKPLVVSMGDYAASGGYYISCAADSIVANPTTLTGSIGVFGIIPNWQHFYKNKLGITIDTVNSNKYADIGVNRALTAFEQKKIQKSIERVYATFIGHVAKGRNMSTTAVDEIGQGRVWTGYDAKEIGLIDTYGGLEKAIEIAAFLSKTEHYRLISLPKKKDPFAEIALDLGKGTNISEILMKKFGMQTKLTEPIEDLLTIDKIQARIPFTMQLK